jgi:hypothetical protein
VLTHAAHGSTAVVLIHVQHVSAHTKVALPVLLLLLLQKYEQA